MNSLQAKALLKIPAPTPLQTLLEAEQLVREPDVEKRYRSIMLRLVPRLEVDLLVAQLSGALGADPQVVNTLLDAARVTSSQQTHRKSSVDGFGVSEPRRQDLVDPTTCPKQFTVLELLGKIATIVNRLTIKPGQLNWILDKTFAVMDVLTLPTNATSVSTSLMTGAS